MKNRGSNAPISDAPTFAYEQRLIARGYARVAGVDEAGRGPLAGPVVAAAVVFQDEDAARLIPDLTDSKKMTERQRETCDALIRRVAIAYAVARIDADEIDRINILQASLKAMATAAASLTLSLDALLIDGNRSPEAHFPRGFDPFVETLVKGDALSLSVAAASVLAKVARDRLMIEYAAEYPEYGFAGHKGYPSQQHRDAVARFGPCPIHRKTFRGVREHTDERIP
ncbi:MAG: ribonuclease HII [Candidatus Poribacteria bacterium]|nr:ribonuclease HII [Candidatus Poribacteria bacterium]